VSGEMVASHKSGSPALALMRRYVTDYINRHDFSVIREIMTDDYRLDTSGISIAGRDGPYRSAVAKQLDQFPGLVFTPHELFYQGDRLAIRFTEHGASNRHAGRRAAWPSIAIYSLRDGKFASCAIEQDYFSRRRQLVTGVPVMVDSPAIAPWDTASAERNLAAESVVAEWLHASAFLQDRVVQVDDSRATGNVERIVDEPRVDITLMVSGGDRVAFHAVQHGQLADDFASEVSPVPGQPVSLYFSGLVLVKDGRVAGGNAIRDRWGLFRRLVPRDGSS
jgi:predicted ester cyclase